jgi:hypothetical protein
MKHTALLLILCGAAARGQDVPPPVPPPDTIHFPPLAPPTPPPIPPPTPGGVPVLPPDVLYVITSNTAFFVVPAPAALVQVTTEVGPISIHGRFIEDPTKTVTKKYAAAHVAIVRAVGTGRVDLVVVPSGATTAAAIIQRQVDCLTAPIPPPVPPVPPIPPVPPTPPPSPAPIPGPGLHALFVYESGKLSALPPAQLAALYSKAVRDYLRGKSFDFRFYDADVAMDGESQLWKDAMKRPLTRGDLEEERTQRFRN